ncbi:unnamed protein product [Spirodela intermedia]|uniref:Uncharacterized protein n=2 Tax=Spirodela intermedia TaxID=51605 RepID=A0A7I8IN20_SPIIN|nr:unnamed protein product [Spirodela intermedia]CAA6658953.1 unnamed protein product [Spirodela intermedia]CAA7395239.1 unnamed protein product [Spirodela intermedia]
MQKSTFCWKSLWPELVGSPADDAAAIIEKENTLVNVVIVKVGMPVTMDYRCSRVRLWVDEQDIVVEVPRIG